MSQRAAATTASCRWFKGIAFLQVSLLIGNIANRVQDIITVVIFLPWRALKSLPDDLRDCFAKLLQIEPDAGIQVNQSLIC